MLDPVLAGLQELQKALLPSSGSGSRGRNLAIGHCHAGTRIGHACCRRTGVVFRNVDLLPRGANGFPPIHGFILLHTGGQASLHPDRHRHRATSCVLCDHRHRASIFVSARPWRSAPGCLDLRAPSCFGILAMVLNYIPYIGAACMTVVLFASRPRELLIVDLAFGPPAAFVALATHRGPVHHAYGAGPPLHAQSPGRAACACLLVLDLGPDGDVSCGTPDHHRVW